jgi:hypothetical protein
MKYFLALLVAVQAAPAQTGTAGIAGTVLDANTLKPVPAALVMAVPGGAPPLGRNTKSGGDGAFQVQGLTAGTFTLCVQAGDGYLDPCQWNGSPVTVTLAAGQAATGISVRLTAASVVTIRVQDAQNVLAQKTKDGRRPELTLGVWGPRGLYYPVRPVDGSSSIGGQQPGVNGYSYQIGVPRDIALKLQISSRDLKLGDALGAALAGNSSQQAFQQVTGDASPKSFAFTVLGLLP